MKIVKLWEVSYRKIKLVSTSLFGIKYCINVAYLKCCEKRGAWWEKNKSQNKKEVWEEGGGGVSCFFLSIHFVQNGKKRFSLAWRKKVNALQQKKEGWGGFYFSIRASPNLFCCYEAYFRALCTKLRTVLWYISTVSWF